MAGREAHVFKFADKPTLYFNCQIRLVTKDGNGPCPVSILSKNITNMQIYIFRYRDLNAPN